MASATVRLPEDSEFAYMTGGVSIAMNINDLLCQNSVFGHNIA